MYSVAGAADEAIATPHKSSFLFLSPHVCDSRTTNGYARFISHTHAQTKHFKKIVSPVVKFPILGLIPLSNQLPNDSQKKKERG